MRHEEIKMLNEPYPVQANGDLHRRFDSAIGAYLRSAEKLAGEILRDLDPIDHGVKWWAALPIHERILIGDYLYQCVNGIQTNLTEAKLHYFEWLDAHDQGNEQNA